MELMMNAAKLLSLGVEAAREAGYEIREEVLEGAGGGHCIIRGKKCLLLDMTQTHREQLTDVLDALRAEKVDATQLHPVLAASLAEPLQKAA
jgi:hypothetical protein